MVKRYFASIVAYKPVLGQKTAYSLIKREYFGVKVASNSRQIRKNCAIIFMLIKDDTRAVKGV